MSYTLLLGLGFQEVNVSLESKMHASLFLLPPAIFAKFPAIYNLTPYTTTLFTAPSGLGLNADD